MKTKLILFSSIFALMIYSGFGIYQSLNALTNNYYQTLSELTNDF